MKLMLYFAGLIYISYFIHGFVAAPTDTFALELEEDLQLVTRPSLELHRQKRATCDLLSATPISGALCNAHCFFTGKGSGKCNQYGVCVCSE